HPSGSPSHSSVAYSSVQLLSSVFLCLLPPHLFLSVLSPLSLFFFNAPATTAISTLSLHDALPIFSSPRCWPWPRRRFPWTSSSRDRKSTRLNSSHVSISYAVLCLKNKSAGCGNNQRALHGNYCSMCLAHRHLRSLISDEDNTNIPR